MKILYVQCQAIIKIRNNDYVRWMTMFLSEEKEKIQQQALSDHYLTQHVVGGTGMPQDIYDRKLPEKISQEMCRVCSFKMDN